jgi:outer membrane protein OmpA-like peptidoglycan-associated protein
MKTRFFALLGIMLILLPMPAPAKYFGPSDTLSANYVVIGAFAYKKNALRFTTHANKPGENLKLKAKFELNANRNLYYVYVLVTDDHQQAIQEAMRLRTQTEFSDSWVYHGPLSKNDNVNKPDATATHKGVDINPATNEKIDNVIQNDIAPASANESSAPVVVAEKSNAALTETSVADKTTASSGESSGERKFIFKLFKAIDNSPLEGDVEVIDAERSKKIGTYKGNVTVNISTTNKSKRLTFVCDVFGYRKVQRELDYTSRKADDITLGENRELVIPFELVRLQKGDIAVMYNVYFFKDAGVMRPESRFEINSLHEMLKENPKYKIKIHGHTNGGAAGKIISIGESKNFFSLSGTEEGIGSAKKLSEERAKVIKEYLIANGIDESRMIIKAWGGKRPIHDKLSNRAQENVRVEIEILEN